MMGYEGERCLSVMFFLCCGVLFLVGFFCFVGFFFFPCISVILVILTPKKKKPKSPRISGGRGCVLLKVRIKQFSQNSILKNDILTAEKTSIMELSILKDETVKDMGLPLKLLSWPGVGLPTELSALPRLREQCNLSGNAC